MTTFNEPFTFTNGVKLRNRFIMAPMTTVQSFFDGTITQDELHYYAQRAKGVGAVITGAANVQANGKGWPGELSIAQDDKLPELTQLANVIHNGGAKAIVQIFHGGRMSEPAALLGHQALSASAIPAQHRDKTRPTPIPRAMTVAEIHATIAAFGEATRRAIQAGFDGVELHGANTYLLQQFFSAHSNRRTDAYGGSLEKRYTFIKEVIATVFKTVATYAQKPFIVGYRFSPEEFTTPGISMADTLYLLAQLTQTPLTYLHVSLDDYQRVATAADYQAKSILQYVHAAIAGKIPLIGVGGVRTRTDVNHVLQQTELVAVGQQLLVDPYWVQKLEQGCDADMISSDFAQAIEYTNFSRPLYDYLVARYRSTPNI
ncbi:NADH-dependent flavin oxidoreductase [Loigolactobacillus zhaoyuanensis]|uniref:NADH-dependent flavin oxidoreductase n=1 Tax=Loigolactobacillus zhaoyuanensis TaxID=2486017 RepID=A0ABW8UDF6_9LACO